MIVVMRRYEPTTPRTKRAALNDIITNLAGRRDGATSPQVEGAHETCNALACKPLDEDLRVTIIIETRVKDLKGWFEFANQDVTHPCVREEILRFIERRDTFGGPRKPIPDECGATLCSVGATRA